MLHFLFPSFRLFQVSNAKCSNLSLKSLTTGSDKTDELNAPGNSQRLSCVSHVKELNLNHSYRATLVKDKCI